MLDAAASSRTRKAAGSRRATRRLLRATLIVAAFVARDRPMAAQPVPRGIEFQVNTYTGNAQNRPRVALDTTGNFVVVWASLLQDGSANGAFAQRYDSLGGQRGIEFQIDTVTSLAQSRPAVAADADGDFVITWDRSGGDGNGYGVFAKRFDSGGVPRGIEFQVNTYFTGVQANSSVAMNALGDFVVVWTSPHDGVAGVFAQRFSSAGTALGTELQVNTYSTGVQTRPMVATDSIGNFVVVWDSENQDGANYGVFAQRFTSAGAAVGVEFKVSTFTSGSQRAATVGLDFDGDFVVAWESTNLDGGLYGVFAQRFSSAGATQGGEFQVNTYTIGDQRYPSLALDDNGGFVVLWRSIHDGSDQGIFGRRFSSAGVAEAVEFQVNTYTPGAQSAPFIDLDADGDFVAAWDSALQDGASTGVFAQRFANPSFPTLTPTATPTGPTPTPPPTASPTSPATSTPTRTSTRTLTPTSTPTVSPTPSVTPTPSTPPTPIATPEASGDEFQVNSYTASFEVYPAVAMDADGDFVVVWEGNGDHDGEGSGIFGQRFASSGSPRGSEFQVNAYTAGGQLVPAVAMRDDGDFVVVWSSTAQDPGNAQDGGGSGVFGRRFDSSGAPQATEFQVTTFTAGDQDSVSIAMKSTGELVVVWASYGQDGFRDGIFARRFDSNGAPAAEFQVNTYTDYFEYAPDVAMQASGGFVVVWAGRDGSQYGVLGRRFDSAGNAQGVEFQVNVTTSLGQGAPAVAMSDNGAFAVTWTSFNGQDGSGEGIFGRRFDSAGTAQGGELQVNSFITAGQTYSDLAMAPDGSFVVTWVSGAGDGSDDGIVGRGFDASGGGSDEFVVNVYYTSAQRYPAIAIDDQGDFVVAWSSYGQDGFYSGIFARLFTLVGTGPVLDADGNGDLAATTDGVLIVRYLFGFTGEALVSNATAGNCKRCDAGPVIAYLDSVKSQLDIDDNGSVGPLTDGMLVLRYLFVATGEALTGNAVGPGCGRCNAGQILPYLDELAD